MYVFHKMKQTFNDHFGHLEEPTLWGIWISLVFNQELTDKESTGLSERWRTCFDHSCSSRLVNKSLTSDWQIWVASQQAWAQSQRRQLNGLHWLHIWFRRKGLLLGLCLEKNTPKCITLTEIHLMWKHGADLLSTHSESQKNHVTVISFTGWWHFTDNVCHGQTLQTQTQPCALLSRKALFHGFISSFGFNIKFQHSNHTVQSQIGLLESNAFKQATSTAPCHVVCSTRHRTEIKIWQSWVFIKEVPLSLWCREPRNGLRNQRRHYEKVPMNSFHTTMSCLSQTWWISWKGFYQSQSLHWKHSHKLLCRESQLPAQNIWNQHM